jgi:hypothetical protein
MVNLRAGKLDYRPEELRLNKRRFGDRPYR